MSNLEVLRAASVGRIASCARYLNLGRTDRAFAKAKSRPAHTSQNLFSNLPRRIETKTSPQDPVFYSETS